MLTRKGHADFNGVKIFHMFIGDFLDDFRQKRSIPSVGEESLLENLVEQRPVYERWRCFARGLDSILKYSTAHAAKRVGNDG